MPLSSFRLVVVKGPKPARKKRHLCILSTFRRFAFRCACAETLHIHQLIIASNGRKENVHLNHYSGIYRTKISILHVYVTFKSVELTCLGTNYACGPNCSDCVLHVLTIFLHMCNRCAVACRKPKSGGEKSKHCPVGGLSLPIDNNAKGHQNATFCVFSCYQICLFSPR